MKVAFYSDYFERDLYVVGMEGGPPKKVDAKGSYATVS
jgi:hypothetical protein